MATQKIEFMPTYKDAVSIGIKNFFPLLIAVILYGLTFWIPWLNVGTTIGLYRIVIDLTKGETIDPLSIFDKENFTNVGNFFLLIGLLAMGVSAAMVFMFVPAFVMGIAWGFAYYILIEKKVRPLKALDLSYKATYGEKWRIFFIQVVAAIIVTIIIGLLAVIPKVGIVLVIVFTILTVSFFVALEAVMYRHFSDKVDEILASERPFFKAQTPEGPAGPETPAAPEAPAVPAAPAPAPEEPSPYAPKETSSPEDSPYAPKPEE